MPDKPESERTLNNRAVRVFLVALGVIILRGIDHLVSRWTGIP